MHLGAHLVGHALRAQIDTLVQPLLHGGHVMADMVDAFVQATVDGVEARTDVIEARTDVIDVVLRRGAPAR